MNKSPRILIVEDDPDISHMIKLMFERKGFSTLIATREEEVQEMLHSHKIDLVMMDMLLSGVNGTEICTRLKQDPNTAHIPIVMTSAHPNAEEICKAAGANDFIAKPFDMKDMLSRVSRLTGIEPRIQSVAE